MGRAPCCDKSNVKKGPWSPEEDASLKDYIEKHGTGGNWIALPQKAGLKRCGKSCRLRWLNYLRPNIKHGKFSDEEDQIICSLFASFGSRWSIIASQLPERTDNDIKNYWNTKLKKKFFAISATCNQKKLRHHQGQLQSVLPNFSFNATTPPSPEDSGVFLNHSQERFSTTSQGLKNFNAINNYNNSDSFLVFGSGGHQQQICSSSDASTTQFLEELDLECRAAAAAEQQLVIDSFLSNGEVAVNQSHVVDGLWKNNDDSSITVTALEYSPEEIKQLLLQQQHYHNPTVNAKYSFYH